MKPSRPNYPRFLYLLSRIKLIELTAKFPPLPGGWLDEQTRLMRAAQIALGEVPISADPPAQTRARFHDSIDKLKSVGGLFEPVDSVRDLTIPSPAGGIPARLYLPGKDTNYPLFIFYHGGGWVIGDLHTGDNVARFLCKHVPCAVLSVDYRLAPENPFPAAVDDAYAALEWAAAHAVEINADPQRILVGGDSAGGNLSAVVAQMAKQKGGPQLSGQVLMYPVINGTALDTPSYQAFDDPMLGLPKRDMQWYFDQYTPNPADRANPLVSPIQTEDLSGLAPALVITAEYDVLRDEGEAYARRLEEAGVPVRRMRCNGMIHGFINTIGLIHRSTQYLAQAIIEIRWLLEK